MGSILLEVAKTCTPYKDRGHLERLGDTNVPPDAILGRVTPKICGLDIRVIKQQAYMGSCLLGLGLFGSGKKREIVRFQILQHLGVMGLRHKRNGKQRH